MRYVMLLGLLISWSASAHDTLRDCQTFGPHSDSCARALSQRDDPEAVAKQFDRRDQDRRDRPREWRNR